LQRELEALDDVDCHEEEDDLGGDIEGGDCLPAGELGGLVSVRSTTGLQPFETSSLAMLDLKLER
jgi:hypothetical protein